jgi:hypothetical protein
MMFTTKLYREEIFFNQWSSGNDLWGGIGSSIKTGEASISSPTASDAMWLLQFAKRVLLEVKALPRQLI